MICLSTYTERSRNTSSKKELTPYLRGKIIRKAKEGKKLAQIAKELQIADSTIRDTLKLDLYVTTDLPNLALAGQRNIPYDLNVLSLALSGKS
ncbi:uncharacterized protein RSE6_01627 [Rhynchosporium secalis]|uniref:Uncharacterized protein n=1 Tax=Rhynchosporium secalis TaxID=38038 RepID=A0A1E1LYA1_RHYSE|nr:uncharacterized protein RSE6_01627 [Rhynchosporium secalis]